MDRGLVPEAAIVRAIPQWGWADRNSGAARCHGGIVGAGAKPTKGGGAEGRQERRAYDYPIEIKKNYVGMRAQTRRFRGQALARVRQSSRVAFAASVARRSETKEPPATCGPTTSFVRFGRLGSSTTARAGHLPCQAHPSRRSRDLAGRTSLLALALRAGEPHL